VTFASLPHRVIIPLPIFLRGFHNVLSSITLEGAGLGESRTESELLHRALAGDANAFASLCDQHRRRVWRVAASVARGPDVDDLAQETVIRAFCSLKSYRFEAPFQAWLCRIALNLAHDYQRSAWKRRVVVSDEVYLHEDHEELKEQVESRETARQVRQAVAGLPAKQRSPIWLHFFEEFSVAEVARLERTAESTIRCRIKAGLERLERRLGEFGQAVVDDRPFAPLDGRLMTIEDKVDADEYCRTECMQVKT
jgi:RNA polymerase sigma-70 factor (ECF subfamily)